MQYDPEHPQMDYGQPTQQQVDIQAISQQLELLEQQGIFENKTSTPVPYSPTQPYMACPPSPVWDEDQEEQAAKEVLEVLEQAYEVHKRAELALARHINNKSLDVRFRNLLLKHVKGVADTKTRLYRHFKDLKLACKNYNE
jgi:hypothetical protein